MPDKLRGPGRRAIAPACLDFSSREIRKPFLIRKASKIARRCLRHRLTGSRPSCKRSRIRRHLGRFFPVLKVRQRGTSLSPCPECRAPFHARRAPMQNEDLQFLKLFRKPLKDLQIFCLYLPLLNKFVALVLRREMCSRALTSHGVLSFLNPLQRYESFRNNQNILIFLCKKLNKFYTV